MNGFYKDGPIYFIILVPLNRHAAKINKMTQITGIGSKKMTGFIQNFKSFNPCLFVNFITKQISSYDICTYVCVISLGLPMGMQDTSLLVAMHEQQRYWVFILFMIHLHTNFTSVNSMGIGKPMAGWHDILS